MSASLVLLKLALAPALIAAATLVARRFGPKVGGVVLGLPLTAGPVAALIAFEQGPRFAGQLAAGFLAGIAAASVFGLVYTRRCHPIGRDWIAAFPLAAIAFAVTAAGLVAAHLPLVLLGASALVANGVALRLIPWPIPVGSATGRRSSLWTRMLVATCALFSLTALAPLLGATASGIITSFPVMASLLAVFTHRELGPSSAVAVCRGFLTGLSSFTGFSVTLVVLLTSLPTAAAFAIAVAVAVAIQLTILGGIVQSAPGKVAH